jgi:serine palmitoyltransferase
MFLKVGKYVCVNGKDCLNLATHNYLGLVENKALEDTAVESIRKYGVGSCGPRGFYGTVGTFFFYFFFYFY